uniref:Gag1-like clamp domain-containing protein n=1 Tax=Ananas comosus var. bracteatus TaxID=296719 RepID=A0A6V7NJS0_ANACO|nr:unnamed protein product [Ananas comosus var. bracteatus]
MQSSSCVGGLAKHRSLSDKNLGVTQRRKFGQASKGKRRQWFSSPEAMENNSITISHSFEAHISSGPTCANENIKISEENGTVLSVVAWNEMRKEWIGDQSRKPRRAPREPIISWCTTYDDLLSTSQRFPQPIPLSIFLVDIWQEEGLYD